MGRRCIQWAKPFNCNSIVNTSNKPNLLTTLQKRIPSARNAGLDESDSLGKHWFCRPNGTLGSLTGTKLSMDCSMLNFGMDTSTGRDRHSPDDTMSCRMLVFSLLVSRPMPRCLLNGGRTTNMLTSPPLYGSSNTCAPSSSELTRKKCVRKSALVQKEDGKRVRFKNGRHDIGVCPVSRAIGPIRENSQVVFRVKNEIHDGSLHGR